MKTILKTLKLMPKRLCLLLLGLADALVRSRFLAETRRIGLAHSTRDQARIIDRTLAVSAHFFRFIEWLDALHAGVWRATDRAVPIITPLDQHPRHWQNDQNPIGSSSSMSVQVSCLVVAQSFVSQGIPTGQGIGPIQTQLPAPSQ